MADNLVKRIWPSSCPDLCRYKLEGMKKMADTKELPGVLVVIFIAGGVLAFLLMFIFGKRQIQRFALKNQKGPHVPLGADAEKVSKACHIL